MTPSVTPGTVYLVGAGPGDPKLITVAGKEALERAEVVVYDRLAHPQLLRHAPEGVEVVYAGKQADRHTLTQDEINAILADRALAGKTVVRLKGGDPFVFGRGGEEAEYLRERKISYVVIPGITSAIAAPAYAGIPVTHRDASSSFAVITGHERSDATESGTRAPGEAEQRRDWSKIAHAADTLIFLMGVESLSEITVRLIENGRRSETPVALIRWGTWAGRQETLIGVLGDITDRAKAANFKAPAVTVIGDVVTWRERLRWWDNRPLSGKRIIVTRAREQASALVDTLAAEGAEPLEFPVIRIAPPSDNYAALDAVLLEVSSYAWLIVTSANGVAALGARLQALGRDARALGGVKVAAVGPSTSEALETLGIRADFAPTKFTGEDVARQFPGALPGTKILIVRAREANEALPEILAARGASVTDVPAYETLLDDEGAAEISARIAAGTVDAVTFTSSSTVKNFVTALGPVPPPLVNVVLACIGPSTAQTARELFQREPDIMADDHTIPGLVAALKTYYRER